MSKFAQGFGREGRAEVLVDTLEVVRDAAGGCRSSGVDGDAAGGCRSSGVDGRSSRVWQINGMSFVNAFRLSGRTFRLRHRIPKPRSFCGMAASATSLRRNQTSSPVGRVEGQYQVPGGAPTTPQVGV